MAHIGIELELSVLLAMLVLGSAVFGRFEAETPAWRTILKWAIAVILTLAVYSYAGHWALLAPIVFGGAGLAVHFTWCRKHGIDPYRATPRRKYYALRGWEFPD